MGTRLFLLYLSAVFVAVTLAQDGPISNEIPKKSSGSCALAGVCCPGRDSSCNVQKTAPNAIPEDVDDIPCYCDHACMTIGDCCFDFKAACGVQDCEISHWGPWSACDQECGLGVMTRERTVLQEARNGGKLCPTLVQKRGCRGIRCPKTQSRLTIEDTAIILPSHYSGKRKLNESSDITKNLRLRYPKNPAKEKSKPYCVEYEVLRTSRACKSLENFANMREGTRVCVACEREAQRAHLEYKCAGTGSDNGLATRFSSLRESACHGKWRFIKSDFTCACNSEFIFV